MVEEAFRQAIGAGRRWLLRAPDLRALQSLCVTENCRTQTDHMIHEDDTSILLWSIDEPDASHIELAQSRFTSIEALEEKLSQYPRGTAFVLEGSPNESRDITSAISRLVAFAASRGLAIKER